MLLQLLQTRRNLVDRAFDLLLLLGKLFNFLARAVEFVFFGVDQLFRLVVLLLDLVELGADLADLFDVVLSCRVVVRRLKKRIYVHGILGTVI